MLHACFECSEAQPSAMEPGPAVLLLTCIAGKTVCLVVLDAERGSFSL